MALNDASFEYDQFIQDIIDSRGQWGLAKDEYKELHHIIPKSLGGLPKYISKNSRHYNLIWLTAKEHFIAHKLLCKKYPGNEKLLYAFAMMALNKNNNLYNEEMTPEEYEEFRIKYSKQNSGENNPMFGKTGIKHPNFGKHLSCEQKARISYCSSHRSEETLEKLRKANIGRILSEDTKKKISEKKCGENNPMYGTHRVMSAETKEKISKKLKGRTSLNIGKNLSEDIKKKISNSHIGKHWYNNGEIEKFTYDCPNGFSKGRLKTGVKQNVGFERNN